LSHTDRATIALRRTVTHDRTNLKTYVRTYGGLEVQMVDLKKIDFAKPSLRTID